MNISNANWMYDIATTAFNNMLHNNPISTGKIIDNLYVVKTGTVNFYIYKNDYDIICIDSGFGKNIILRELTSLGLSPDSITHLFLTHSDIDHISGAQLFQNAKIYLSADEEQMITREKARMFGRIYNPKIKGMYNLLDDNNEVDVGSIKVRVIATPGHTPGSMSYLVNESVLFVGDTFRLIDNKIYPMRQFINILRRQIKGNQKVAPLIF